MERTRSQESRQRRNVAESEKEREVRLAQGAETMWLRVRKRERWTRSQERRQRRTVAESEEERERLDLRRRARKGDKGRLWLRVKVWVTRSLVCIYWQTVRMKQRLWIVRYCPVTLYLPNHPWSVDNLLQSWERRWSFLDPVRTELFNHVYVCVCFNFDYHILTLNHHTPPRAPKSINLNLGT